MQATAEANVAFVAEFPRLVHNSSAIFAVIRLALYTSRLGRLLSAHACRKTGHSCHWTVFLWPCNVVKRGIC